MLKKSHEAQSFNIFDDNDSHQIISPFPEKVWVHTKCATCGAPGVALEYPHQPHDHYCWKHNPRVKEALKN